MLVRVHAASIHVGDCDPHAGRAVRHAPGDRAAQAEEPCSGNGHRGDGRGGRQGRDAVRPGDEVFGWCAGAFAEYAVRGGGPLCRSRPTSRSSRPRPSGCPPPLRSSSCATREGQAGAEGPDQRRVGGRGHVRRADRQGDRRRGDRRVQHRERGHGPVHRRRPVIDYTQEDFTQGGQRYDFILDNVGNHSLSDTRRALTPDGRLQSNGGGHSGGALGTRRSRKLGRRRMFVRQQLRPVGQVPEPRGPRRPEGARRSREGHAGHRRNVPAERDRQGDRSCRRRTCARNGRRRHVTQPRNRRHDSGARLMQNRSESDMHEDPRPRTVSTSILDKEMGTRIAYGPLIEDCSWPAFSCGDPFRRLVGLPSPHLTSSRTFGAATTLVTEFVRGRPGGGHWQGALSSVVKPRRANGPGLVAGWLRWSCWTSACSPADAALSGGSSSPPSAAVPRPGNC